MKKDYWVDFQASIKVRASSSEEAEEIANEILNNMDSNADYYDSVLHFIEIDNIEEGEE